MANKEFKPSTLPSVIFNDSALKIAEAIKTIQGGFCKRVDIGNYVKVYECKNIIRIDIKYDA